MREQALRENLGRAEALGQLLRRRRLADEREHTELEREQKYRSAALSILGAPRVRIRFPRGLAVVRGTMRRRPWTIARRRTMTRRSREARK